jgi:hypothetical protein
MGRAASLLADATVAPFQAILHGPTSDHVATANDASTAESETKAKPESFAARYQQFEESITQFLAKFPELPKLRIQVSSDAKIRLQAADSNRVSPETAKLLAQVESELNQEPSLNRLAGQLYESKSLERWRSGLDPRPTDVELIVGTG